MLSLSPFSNPVSLIPHQTHHHFHDVSFKPFKPHVKPFIVETGPNNSSLPTTPIDEKQPKGDDFRVLTAMRSEYNDIVILETENSKVLLLDDSGNVHSLLYKDSVWTNSYWDEFTSLPAVIPKGPVAIFGLGGGTVAHQLLDVWPELEVDGWELDKVLVDNARLFFGLSGLESGNGKGGVLRVCIGDALSPLASVEGGYAGIIVDLFSDAKVLPQLEEAETWIEMRKKLMPNGRIMVNCGGTNSMFVERGWEVNFTIRTLREAFGGQLVNWKRMPANESGNYLALTGPLPELDTWAASVPEKLSSAVKLWRPCEASS